MADNTSLALDSTNTVSNTVGDVFGVGVHGDQNIIAKTLYYKPTYILDHESRPSCKPPKFTGESKTFVGRQDKLNEINELLKLRVPAISIIGIGGIGKTSLAFKAIHKFQDLYDCIIDIYFELQLSYRTFLFEIAKRLDLPVEEFEKHDLKERAQILKEKLSNFKNGVLIFLDNYETVSDILSSNNPSEDAIKINAFLENTPNNTYLLLTSRQRYNRPAGVKHIELAGLDLTQGRELFIETTSDIKLKEPSTNIQKTIDKLVEKSNGHPLSLIILARSYQGSGLQEIESMLDNIVLKEDRTEISPRLKSIKASFDYSFNTLNYDLKQLLLKLSILQSPFPISTVKTIFGFEKEHIYQLYNRSLLTVINSDKYGDINEDFWLYSFHPTMREYLHKKVNEEGLDLKSQYKEKFCDYYYRLVIDTYLSIGKENYFASIRRFNIIMQAESNDIQELTLLLKDLKQKSRVFQMLGTIFHSQGAYDTSIKFYCTALDIHREIGDKAAMADDYKNLGLMSYSLGNIKLALEYHKKSLDIHREIGDKAAMADDYNNLGYTLQNTLDEVKKVKLALEYHKKSLDIHREIGDKAAMAYDKKNIGSLLLLNGFYLESYEYFKTSFQIYEQIGDDASMADNYNNLGIVFYALGKFNKSLHHLNKALEIYEKKGYNVERADTYNYLGTAYYSISKSLLHRRHRRTKLEKALQYHEIALEIHNETKHDIRAAIDYYNKALILHDMKELKRAAEMLEEARKLSIKQKEKTGHHYPIIDQISIMGSHLNKRKDFFKPNKKRFLLNQLKWWSTLTLASLGTSLGINFLFPFAISYSFLTFGFFSFPFAIATIICISFLWRKRQLQKIGISEKRFKSFSSYYYKQYALRDLRTIGISYAISLGISFFIPFPLSLAVGWSVYPPINYVITKKSMQRLGIITSYRKFYQKPVSHLFDPAANL